MAGAGVSELDGELTAIMRSLEPLLGAPAGAAVPLDGGITNRNYRVTLGDRDYVVRLPGKDTSRLGISRYAERLATQSAASLGIAPALAAQLPDCLVTEFVQARELPTAELRAKPDEVARALRTFHDNGPTLPCEFDVPSLFDQYAETVLERGGTLPEQYSPTRAALARIAAALPFEPLAPCHNDLLNGNLLATSDGRVLIVDWEYAGMGDRYFDLGNLSVNNGFEPADDEWLLAAYLGEAPTTSQRARLALMRIVSDAREAAWGVAQIVLSELDFDFAGYAERHFTRLAVALDDPQLEDWLRGASA
ncbi:MAG: choline kinase family protein [Solirubrobacteraceae bacterium]